MDYTPDSCMDTFTADQKTRMQAVMLSCPRRSSLNSSNGCNPPAPAYVRFNNGSECFTNVVEADGCSHTDYTMTLELTKAPTGGNATVAITKAGTATDMADYEIIGGNITFTANQSVDKTFTLRVYNDGLVESAETIVLGMTVTANGSDLLKTTETSKEYTVTVGDNDVANAVTNTINLFTEDFEDVTGWTTLDEDGDGKNWLQAADQNWPSHGYSGVWAASQSWDTAALTPDNYYSSPAVAIPSGVTNAQVSLIIGSGNDATWYKEHYTVYMSTTKATAANITSGTAFDPDREIPANGTEVRTYNVPASFAGQTLYVSVRHHNSNGIFILGLDDVKVFYDKTTDVQLAINMGTPDKNYLKEAGQMYAKNPANDKVVADINSTSALDYGCVDTYVSRAADFGATAAVMYQVAGVANYVMARTVTITPTTVQASGNATVKFYVYADEIQDWAAQTGNAEGTLTVIKNNSSSSESVTATLGNFGLFRTIEATFATGINGTYYFGKQEAILGLAENDFGNSLYIYPNPSNGRFNLSVSTTDDAKVQLFDIRGRNVYSKLHTNNSDVFNTTLDFSSLASGVYMLDVESGSRRAVKKIIIQ